MGQYNKFKYNRFGLNDRSLMLLEDFHDAIIKRAPMTAEEIIGVIEILQSESDNTSTTLTAEIITEILYFLKRKCLKIEPLTDEQKPFVVQRRIGFPSLVGVFYLAKHDHETYNTHSLADARRWETREEAERFCQKGDEVLDTRQM